MYNVDTILCHAWYCSGNGGHSELNNDILLQIYVVSLWNLENDRSGNIDSLLWDLTVEQR